MTSSNPLFSLAQLLLNARKLASGMAMDTGAAAPNLLVAQDKGEFHTSHPYFKYYGMLSHQQNMLQDHIRTKAYHDAIVGNPTDFAGKVVLDVGTGSGILAYFAAKAGARKVYAIEASDMAIRAAELLAANGMGDRIIVVKGKIEEVSLPEQVDIIVSEPMGFMLIHEQMLQSYVHARKFLRPGGKMFPAKGIIFAAPFTDPTLWQETFSKGMFWNTPDFHGLDLRPLAETAIRDNFAQPAVGFVDPSSLISSSTCTHTIDFERVNVKDMATMRMPLDFVVTKSALCHGIAAWFDVTFEGSDVRSVLPTGPYTPLTHWHQCRLQLRDPIAVNVGQRLTGSLLMVANDRYSYDLTLALCVAGSEATTADGKVVQSVGHFALADQNYVFMSNTAT